MMVEIRKHNKENGIRSQYQDSHPLMCCITFTKDSFSKEYPFESRTYKFRSDNKYFLPDMGGKSVFASSLDGTDKCVRLDWYWDEWKIENCFIMEDNNENN